MGKTVRFNPETYKKEREKYYGFEHKMNYWKDKLTSGVKALRKKDEKRLQDE